MPTTLHANGRATRQITIDVPIELYRLMCHAMTEERCLMNDAFCRFLLRGLGIESIRPAQRATHQVLFRTYQAEQRATVAQD